MSFELSRGIFSFFFDLCQMPSQCHVFSEFPADSANFLPVSYGLFAPGFDNARNAQLFLDNGQNRNRNR